MKATQTSDSPVATTILAFAAQAVEQGGVSREVSLNGGADIACELHFSVRKKIAVGGTKEICFDELISELLEY